MNYTYDYRGNRVRSQWVRNVGGNGTNIFLYEPNSPSGMNQVLEELSASGATPTVSYTLGSRIMSQGKGGVISHILSDGHGSTRLLTDVGGGVAAQYNYDAYGKAVNFQTGVLSPPDTTMLYSGEQLDADLQQYHLVARYYNPTIGRFNQIDPFSANQQSGANLYAYCADDPVNNSDPSGLYEIDVHQYLTRYLADKVGFGNAGIIGHETQALDEDSRAAMYFGLGWHNMAHYHFVSHKRLSNLASKADLNKSSRSVGEFLHAQEDTYAHCSGVGKRDWDYYGNLELFGGGFPFGHLFYGHAPDHTWNDEDKGMQMAKRVYLDLKNIHDHNGKYEKPDDATEDIAIDPADIKWQGMEKEIMGFIHFTPEMFPGTGEFVTHKGYLDKVGMLHLTLDPNSKDSEYLQKAGRYKSSFIERGGHISGYNVGSSDVGIGVGGF